MQNEQKLGKNVWALIKPYWTSEEKWQALLLLAGVLACNIIQVRIVIIMNSWRKHFYDALQIFSMHYVLLSLLEFLIILVLAILVFSYGNFFAGMLVNRWRRWMTEKYASQWLNNNVAYAMQVYHKSMDNPDQRISEDLNEFPQLTLALFSGLFNALLTFVSFSFILWQLSGELVLNINKNHTLVVPGYMFFATMLYAGIGTWIMIKIGKNLMGLNYRQEQFNANFRFGLVRVRESAEQIALYGGANTEKNQLMASFSHIFQNFFAIIRLQKTLAFFTNGYNLLVQIVGILIALPRYVHERLAIGSLLQVSNAFEQVVSALSFVVVSFSMIANWRAVIWRLTEFTHLIQASEENIGKKLIKINFSENLLIETSALTLTTPDNLPLVEKLTLTIRPREHLMITGKYGSGKSTLLRAIANIWPYGQGCITLPQHAKTLFLPQRPYFPLGTLKQALFYPLEQWEESAISDEALKTILSDCGLSGLGERLSEIRYWPLEFSLGEQQLIAFARIFIYKPDWVFLDEATSALDEKTEEVIYSLLKTRLPDITMVSVGHRSSLKKFHHQIVEIKASHEK